MPSEPSIQQAGPGKQPRERVHPRPQLVRERWQDLCGQWQFAFDDTDHGMAERWFASAEPFEREITVPYPPESKLSGIGDQSLHPVVWYRREVELAQPDSGRRVLLHFGAVDYAASVWVNGFLVGTHEGGHTPFSFDITDLLSTSERQCLVVRAEDYADDATQPRGKQDWLPEPHGIWYHRTTGIWQPVWFEIVSGTHVSELHWVPDVVGAGVGMQLRLAGPLPDAYSLRVRLRLGDELLAEQSIVVVGAQVDLDVAIPAARHGQYRSRLLWSPENPTLVDAEITLLDGEGVAVDEVHSYFGFREVRIGDGRFVLNGHPYFLRLVLEQGYWPGSHLAAPDEAALRREVELIKDLGFNGVRIHQKVEDPRFLHWCDRLGLLVWDEMPSAYEFSQRAIGRVMREWTEVVARDRSHPCVVTWVPLNESWGVPHIEVAEQQQHYATALYHLTRALDPSRPVISNDGWEHTESDIWGVHDYAADGDTLRGRYADSAAVARLLSDRRPGRRRILLGEPEYRGQPIVLTEFGGLSFVPAEGERWFGYATVSSTEQLEERLADLVSAISQNPELAGFCYTQLTDTEQERNGLLTEDRVSKLPIERVREIMSQPARAIPSEQIDASRRAALRASRGTTAG